MIEVSKPGASSCGGGRAARRGGGRPHRARGDERGRVRADLPGLAGEPAADVRRGAREGGGHISAVDLPAARRRADPDRRGGPSGESRRAGGGVPARGQASAGPPPSREQVRATRWRCRAGGCTRRSRSRCDCTPTAMLRWRSTTTWWFRSCRASTSRVPLSRTRAAGSCRRLRCERTLATHRRAVREHLGRVDALRSELEAEGMATELLDGEQVVHLCGRALTRRRRTGAGARRAPGSCWGSSTRRSSATRRSRRACGCGRRSPARASTSTATRISRMSIAMRSRRSWSRRPRGGRAWGGCMGRC